MDPLSAVLEESATFPSTSSLLHPEDTPEGDLDLEPVPTLASLLLSTAESLSTRTTPHAVPPVASAPLLPSTGPTPPPAFHLPSAPASLLAEPSSTEYLSTLLALPLPSLQALPASLSSLASSLDNDLSALAFARYSSFLLSHSATQQIATSFDSLSDTLSSLLTSTAALESAATTFEGRVESVRTKRARMARVRERIEDVEELLEAPNVVDACVRAGYWSEAIDVAVRLAELHTRLVNTPRNPTQDGNGEGDGAGALFLLKRVRDQVSLALLSLRARVLESLLQRGLKLPGAVRGIGILRRMNGGGLGLEDSDAVGSDKQVGKTKGAGEMSDEALRIVFLAARWRCLRGELESVEAQMTASGIKLPSNSASGAETNGSRPRAGSKAAKESSKTEEETAIGAEENEERTRWAKRWIEVWREVVGETVGMYTEVFLSSTASATQTSSDESSSSDALPVAHLSPSAPLALFLSSSLDALSETLLASLPSLTSTSSLASLLTQLAYCSHSFARHGLEFREFENIRENVEDRVAAIVVAEWEAAGLKWETEWRAGWEGGVRRRGRERKPLHSWLVVAEGLSTVLSTPVPPPAEGEAPASWHHQPSPSLALLPPLARLLNAHATALNSLRLLPAIALYSHLNRAQLRQLDRAAQVLGAFVDAWLASVEALPSSRLSASTGGGDEDPTSEEAALLAEKDEERKLIIFAIAAFSRWLAPWCEGALRVGVYAELGEKEPEKFEAVLRAEKLLAKLEGRVENGDASASEAPTSNGTTSAAAVDLVNSTPLTSPPSAPEPPLSPTTVNGTAPPLASDASSIISTTSSMLSNGNGINGAMEAVDESTPLSLGEEEEETEAVVLPDVVGEAVEVIEPELASTKAVKGVAQAGMDKVVEEEVEG